MAEEQKNEQASLIPLANRERSMISLTLVRRGLDSLKSKEGRIVHFPPGYSLGTCFITRDGECFDSSNSGQEAQGDVFVPSGLKLELWLHNTTPLNALSILKPDDLFTLVCWDFADGDLFHLERLTALKKLSLHHCNISSKGIAHLKKLVSLESLVLFQGAVISNESLIHIKEMSSLTMLALIGKKISDEGLALLQGMTSLKLLDVSENNISDEGLASLQKWLPNCQIFF